MNKLTKPLVNKMCKDVESALSEIEKKYGVSIKNKGARFTDTNATIKIEASVLSGNGEVITREAENFKLNKKLNNWKFDLGSKFNVSGKIYSIAGYNPKARKYPFVVSNRGKMYKMSESMISHYLG